MNPIRFALAFHNHQPVGNIDSIIERIYWQSYLPFLKVLSGHPEIKANLHYTGFLLEWFESKHPEFIDLLRRLANRGQIEFLGGAYYEAILSIIPDKDALGQIEMLSQKLHSLFGVAPRGAWLAERAWEPTLPEVLQRAKINYTMVDDNLFESTGLSERSCFEPYSVESRGSTVVVLPILRQLRYLMPFKPVPSTISFLNKAQSKGAKVVLYADDGEKFGAWPSTFDRVFVDGWLEKFFRAIEVEQRRGRVKTIKLSEELAKRTNLRRTYLPSGSYPELREWSLALGSQTARIAQGFFRQFLSKYPESWRMYSKMLRVSKLAHLFNDKQSLSESWKGQCNDAYWHGVFGGLYAPLLRRNTYEHLIRAQVISEKLLRRGNWISIENTPSSFVLDTRKLSVEISKEMGGSMTELDLKTKCFNIFDTLASRPEKYHSKLQSKKKSSRGKGLRSIHDTPLVIDERLKDLLSYDRHEKTSFMDYLLTEEADSESFARQNFKEIALFAGETYESQTSRGSDDSKVILKRIANHGQNRVSLEKTYLIRAESTKIVVSYSISSTQALSCKFVPEINLGCLADSQFIHDYGRRRSINSGELVARYPEIGISVSLTVPDTSSVASVPIWTVSQSEKGVEKNMQGISILPFHKIELGRGEKFETEIELEVKD